MNIDSKNQMYKNNNVDEDEDDEENEVGDIPYMGN